MLLVSSSSHEDPLRLGAGDRCDSVRPHETSRRASRGIRPGYTTIGCPLTSDLQYQLFINLAHLKDIEVGLS